MNRPLHPLLNRVTRLWQIALISLVFGASSTVFSQQSEVDSLLGATHATSWGYFRDAGKAKWYIANALGSCYSLGPNSRGHSAWIELANGQTICSVDFVSQRVAVSPSASTATPSDRYVAISLVGGEGSETMQGSAARQWANLISGQNVPLDWFFFRVESSGIWYIVWLGAGDSTVLKLNLNASLSDYDWKLPVDARSVSVDTSGWSKRFFQEAGVWKVQFGTTNPTGGTSGPTNFLSFPITSSLYGQGAFTANKIISVVDHHMSAVYTDHDGSILSFTGELFQATTQHPPASQACYPKAGGATWSALLSSLYKGTTGDGCATNVALNYEAHPGYDYVASTGTAVLAAASGRVVNANGGCIPKGIQSAGCAAWGAIGIDHGNGYVTQYLHLSNRLVNAGDTVVEGQQIGLSGNTSPAGTSLGAHLHFEVLRLRSGYANDYSPGSYATVDPYGFDTSRGNADYLTTFNANLPNVCLWKSGCRYQ